MVDFMTKLTVVIIFLISAGIVTALLFSNIKTGSQPQSPTTPKTTSEKTDAQPFDNPKKSAHYESNTPSHGSVLAEAPINTVINFNFDLAKNSSISITKDGKEYGMGEIAIDVNKLSMRRNVDPNAPDGVYTVSYKACWPDGSCHDGTFQFAIDRKAADTYTDFRGKKEVAVDLANITFVPQNIRISKGTKVIWTNSDSVEHYINTDSHPAHTYYSAQNSKALKKGDSYLVTFDKAGIYPYHCSAHAGSMAGSILVE